MEGKEHSFCASQKVSNCQEICFQFLRKFFTKGEEKKRVGVAA